MWFRTSPMEASQTMTNNSLIVERSVPVPVLPEEETPGGSLFLSKLDQATNFFASIVYSFDRSDPNMVDVMKQTLSKVLVHYYPLAGRLAKTSQWKLTVDCNKLGVPFLEASANCNIEDLGDMRLLDPSFLEKLVYRSFTESTLEVAPLLTAQVTKFRCGGFTLGIVINHCMVDGYSMKNFMNSWAEIARGRPSSFVPCHDRTILKSRVPPQITSTSDCSIHMSDVSNLMALYEDEQIAWKSFHFDREKLETLKKMATSDGQKSNSSSFIALAALVWRARSMALNMKPHQLSKLLLSVNFRSKLKPPIPRYFGNAIVQACCLCTAGELIDEPFSSTVGRIKKAIERVDEDYVWSWIYYLQTYQFNFFSLSSLLLTSWQRFDYDSVDFGWGKLRTLGTGDLPRTTCAFMPDGSERKGIVVVMGLPLSAMNTFEKLLQFSTREPETPSMRSRARL
ncbi:omega-hydroxypalmitate O-feruloyl transferase-like [Rhodamnia argentea]|uniref:Omega-hydroxypalmitate O-feruloyl transferase-like n=1 Tax=Rhodamnia argentea TaxID=178133 RepID=A0A8B8PXB4_9MYRT|nr:omega-hydroxypalmitate O-feruloyl transferase-like [Rhodamnia argentea]XP_030538896.1 omega-hydroxypalmitate O-feruloyl transferase-like [Rhodamnia argentea]